MKALRVLAALGALGLLGALPAAPIHAEDQSLQAILQKLRCVPLKVVRTQLAAGFVSYEVACKGRPDAVFIVCQGAGCRQQTKRLDGEEREPP